jgi:hypothetical protein
MSSYTLSKVEYTSLKRRLTVAQSQMRIATSDGDADAVKAAAEKIITEVDKAYAVFERKGYPDAWSAWERARDDARQASSLRGAKTGGGW